MAWRFSACDKNGPYCWSNFESSDKFKEIIEKLHEFETMTMEALKGGGSHPVEVHKLDKTARDRLVTLMRDDIDELMSFRLNGKNRVWCVREENIMRILWWDPNHKVCPANKKNT